jgi:hypothetical protein
MLDHVTKFATSSYRTTAAARLPNLFFSRGNRLLFRLYVLSFLFKPHLFGLFLFLIQLFLAFFVFIIRFWQRGILSELIWSQSGIISRVKLQYYSTLARTCFATRKYIFLLILDRLENLFYICCMLNSLHPVALIQLVAFYALGFSFYKLHFSPHHSVLDSLRTAFYAELLLDSSAKQLPSIGLNFPMTAVFVSFSFRGTNAPSSIVHRPWSATDHDQITAPRFLLPDP